MKVLVLNGSEKDDDSLDAVYEIILNELKILGWEITSFILHRSKIANCQGCFICLIKTPGICFRNDDGNEIAKTVIQSDLVVFLTPIIFGGYSAELKKAFDRFIQLLLPYFMEINGETHHEPRYNRFPRFMAVGILPHPDEESERLFNTLVSRNTIGFHSPAPTTGVLISSQEPEKIREKIQTLLTNLR